MAASPVPPVSHSKPPTSFQPPHCSASLSSSQDLLSSDPVAAGARTVPNPLLLAPVGASFPPATTLVSVPAAPKASLQAADPSFSGPLSASGAASAPTHFSAPLPAAPPPTSKAAPAYRSYAQVARPIRGPGFVQAHASDIESFARLPRTGVNIICGSREGVPSFSFSKSDLSKVEELYSNALVLKFLGGRPSLESSHQEIARWGMERPFTIGPLTSRSFLLRFQHETDLLKVLTRPSSTLISFPYKVFRWFSSCHLTEDSCMAPVWITLPRLPLQCFIPEFLESVANRIGRFLCLDKATATLARPSSARLCVEIDLRKTQPTVIWVGLMSGFQQPIIYEKLPLFCLGCHIRGHTDVNCSKRSLDNPITQAVNRNPLGSSSTPSVRQNASTILATDFHVSDCLPGINTIPSSSAGHSSLPSSTPKANVTQHTPSQPVRSNALPPSHSICTPGVRSNASEPSSGAKQFCYPPLDQSFIPSSSAARKNRHYSTPSSKDPAKEQTAYVDSVSYASIKSRSANKITTRASNQKSAHPPASNRVQRPHKKKPVEFILPLKKHTHNIEANLVLWDALQSQLASIEQYSLHTNTVIPPQPPDPFFPKSKEDHNCEPINSPVIETAMNSHAPDHNPIQVHAQPDSDSDSSFAADSLPASPVSSFSKIHKSSLSEGEEPPTESCPFQGRHSDDNRSLPKTARRNKRHPDQPLNIKLRARRKHAPQDVVTS